MTKTKILVLYSKLVLFSALLLCFCYNAEADEYQRNGENMTQQVRAEHILVQTEDQAKKLKSQIEEGASFEELAKEYSQCPSGASGGDLGYFTRGQMVQPFENAAFDTETGKVSDPVQTQFGWHLIKVIDKK